MNNSELIFNNLIIFSNLLNYQKVFIDEQYNVHIDDRYGQFFRRWYTNDTRDDLYIVIKFTFNQAIILFENDNIQYDFIKKSLDNLIYVSKYTYPEYHKLHELLNKINNNLNIIKHNKINIDYCISSDDITSCTFSKIDNDIESSSSIIDLESQAESIINDNSKKKTKFHNFTKLFTNCYYSSLNDFIHCYSYINHLHDDNYDN
jgi:hypothetical protein